jgi:hypothetical protein
MFNLRELKVLQMYGGRRLTCNVSVTPPRLSSFLRSVYSLARTEAAKRVIAPDWLTCKLCTLMLRAGAVNTDRQTRSSPERLEKCHQRTEDVRSQMELSSLVTCA